MKWFQRLLTGLMLLCSATAFAEDLLSRIKQDGRIVVGVKADYPPWGMLNAEKRHTGFEPDLARQVAKALGVEVVFKTITTANRFQKLNEAQVDLLIATVGDTEERRHQVKMVLPHYFRSGVTGLVRKSAAIKSWTDLIGQPVCLTAGAYFNKALVQNYRIKPIILMNNRDAKLALMTNKCRAWAYDSGILFHLSTHTKWQNFHTPLETIMPIHWSFVTRSDEDSQPLANWLSTFIASRIRSGMLVHLAAGWGLPETSYLARQRDNWNTVDATGTPVCSTNAIQTAPDNPFCFNSTLTLSKHSPSTGWPLDHFDTQRLIQSLLHTALFTLMAIGSAVALALLFSYCSFYSPRWLGKSVAFLTHLQSTIPPILMLYLIYFGALSSDSESGQHWFSDGMSVAWLVLALYTAAGINNLVTAGSHHNTSLKERYLLHGPGVKANLVNQAKAAGMASVIASPNAVLVINSLVASSGHSFLLMTLLAAFYYLEVLLCAYLIDHCLSLLSSKLKQPAIAPHSLSPKEI